MHGSCLSGPKLVNGICGIEVLHVLAECIIKRMGPKCWTRAYMYVDLRYYEGCRPPTGFSYTYKLELGTPLHLGDGIFNFAVEIPKRTSAKMKVTSDEPFTPIKQDPYKGKLLYYSKVLASSMIDEVELDWKIVAIYLDDPEASSLVNDVGGGTLTVIRDWFRGYNIPNGKPANKSGLGKGSK
ncbi:unnamed protein product [Dovyalis caffra]|uniref:inorganic diphosphatase n=1 Tax=Dovyalis caffra TaxID=77055 RepID=A0AAV1SA54_9ROSI|nr:unnamed protein product [Dovyalis caffra]